VTFAQIQPIFQTHCVSCHRSGGVASPNLQTQSQIVANASVSLKEIEAGRMPQNYKLPEEQIALIRAWIAGGKQ
jgi:mono/diheme cytochrome c family protein